MMNLVAKNEDEPKKHAEEITWLKQSNQEEHLADQEAYRKTTGQFDEQKIHNPKKACRVTLLSWIKILLETI